MKTTTETDQELVARCKAELPYRTEAFAQLVHRYQDKVMGKVVGMLRNHEESRDMCQDIFIRAFQGLPSFQGDASFSTWLYAITVNTCLNHIDKMKRRPWWWMGEDIDALQIDPQQDTALFHTMGQRLESDVLRQRIEQTMATLSNGDREVLRLRFLEELDYQTIADRLGVGLSAVKMRIKRARENFRIRYNVYGGQQDE